MLWLSNYHQNLLAHILKQQEAKRAVEKEREKSLITLAFSTVRSLIKPSYLPVMPSQEPTISLAYQLKNIWKNFFFSLKIIQDFCLGFGFRYLGVKKKNNHTAHTRDSCALMESVCMCLCLYIFMCMSTCMCVFQLDKCGRITLGLAS